MKIIDCKGLTCPKPVILTKNELEAMIDDKLEVIVDNAAAKENVSKFVRNQGHECKLEEKNGLFHIIITKKSNCDCEVMDFPEKGLIILITSNKFGEGDDKLGTALMKSYLYALTENDIKPEKLFFINSGVKLVCEGSEVLDSIKALVTAGVEINSCGTCLDFYDLKDQLLIGGVTNMYTIVESSSKAINTIKI